MLGSTDRGPRRASTRTELVCDSHAGQPMEEPIREPQRIRLVRADFEDPHGPVVVFVGRRIQTVGVSVFGHVTMLAGLALERA